MLVMGGQVDALARFGLGWVFPEELVLSSVPLRAVGTILLSSIENCDKLNLDVQY